MQQNRRGGPYDQTQTLARLRTQFGQRRLEAAPGRGRLRAEAWAKTRDAELEALVNRMYDGMDIPEIAAPVAKASEVMVPYIAEFDLLFAEHYPAEFARAALGVVVTPGGIPPKMRDKVRQDAAKHIHARKAYMLANSSSYVTETLADATLRTTDNPEVREVLVWPGEAPGNPQLLLRPSLAGTLRVWHLDRRVNSPKNNGPSYRSRSIGLDKSCREDLIP